MTQPALTRRTRCPRILFGHRAGSLVLLAAIAAASPQALAGKFVVGPGDARPSVPSTATATAPPPGAQAATPARTAASGAKAVPLRKPPRRAPRDGPG